MSIKGSHGGEEDVSGNIPYMQENIEMKSI